MQSHHTTDKITIVTCSYAPDAQRCRRLCQSIDRFVPASIEHYLIVPQGDLPMFHDLHSGRRRVVTTEDVIPAPLRQIPLTSKWWLLERSWPVRGWIMQQITKLSANEVVDTELILFADSDLAFIRPFDPALYCRDGKTRLHRIPGAADNGLHLRWHHRAADLLGLEPRYFGSDYIGQLITWRRSHLSGLHRHMENQQGAPWYRSVARSLQVSEYILYGVYAEHVLGEQQHEHFYCSEDTCHCCWFRDDAERLGSGADTIKAGAQAVLLQSNLGLDAGHEARLFRSVQTIPFNDRQPVAHSL